MYTPTSVHTSQLIIEDVRTIQDGITREISPCYDRPVPQFMPKCHRVHIEREGQCEQGKEGNLELLKPTLV